MAEPYRVNAQPISWSQAFMDACVDVFTCQKSSGIRRRDETSEEGIAMDTYKSRLSTSVSTPRAKGYNYMQWKPKGTIRDAHPPHAYASQCASLGPYVREVVISGVAGREEQMWVAPTGQATGYSKPPSRSASRETLDTSRDY